MVVFLQSLVSGILIGGIYGLIGIGMTLIMGVMGIINLAHGQLMMIAMYVTYLMHAVFKMDPYLSLLIAMPTLFLLGVVIQRLLLNPLMKVEAILPENQVLMTVGIGMVLTEVARFLFTSDYKSVTTSYSSTALFFGGISFSFPMLIAFLIAVALTLGLFLFRPIHSRHGPGQRGGHPDGCQRQPDHHHHLRIGIGSGRGGRHGAAAHLLPFP